MGCVEPSVGLIVRSLGIALRSLVEQRQRALLSALGIFVGSTAIVLLVAIAKGVQQDIGSEVGDLGVNVLVVIPGRIEEDSLFSPGLLGISYLKEEDVARVRRVPGVRRAVPLTFVGGGVRHIENSSTTILVIATEPGFFEIRNQGFAEGRALREGDSGKTVCVLGNVAKEKLFGNSAAVGKEVVYNNQPYRVVGVAEKRDAESELFSQGGFGNFVYLPYRTIKNMQPNAQINRIFIQTEPDREPRTLVKEVEKALGERLDRNTFSVLTQQDLLKLVFKLMGILTWLLTGLTSIALFVGGVGIMTVMLMSVHERTKEIGIRKAFGAKRRDIFWQFLAEALLLALVGVAAGLGVSAAACWALAKWTLLKPTITAGIVALAVSVCALVGAVFGIAPAMRAASRDPVSSLRYE